MSDRITKKHLEVVVNRMNRIVGADAFALECTGGRRYNVTTRNGSCNPLRIGGVPASTLYDIAHAYCAAMETAFIAVETELKGAASESAFNALRTAFINAR